MTTKNKGARRDRSAFLLESLENRTLFSGYTASLVAPVPVRTDLNFNTADQTLVRNPATGDLYGFDTSGGPNSTGIVYQLDPSTKTLTTITTFSATTGPAVLLQLAIDSNGNLFGFSQVSTPTGGTFENGGGELFELPASNFANPVVLYTFPGTDYPVVSTGTLPAAILVDSNNNIDVLTSSGGANNGGVIDQFQPGENYATPNVLGSMPEIYNKVADAFVLAPNGNFYGTTVAGGANSQGSLWELTPGASVATNIASFDASTTGQGPDGALYADSQNDIFGAIIPSAGSPSGVWEFNSATQQLSLIAPFTGGPNAGTDPDGGVIGDSAGNLYGTTTAGDNGGTFFEVNATTHAVSFTNVAGPTTGTEPIDAPVADGAGNFFITTTYGAANNAGAVVEVSPGGNNGGGGGGGGGTTTLTPVIGKTTIPTDVVADTKLKSNVTVTITNSGGSISKGKETIVLYASADGVIDSSSIQIASITKPYNLKPGKTGTFKLTVGSINVSAGTYTILTQATSSTSGVSSSTTGPSVAVAAPFISINSSIGAVTPAIVKAGHAGSFKLTLTNNGNIPSTGSAIITIGLSIDGTTVAVPLTPLKKSLNLKVGKPQTLVLHVKVAKGTLAGTMYYPIITFTQGSTTFSAVGVVPFSVG